jgi:pimeloyl-ACP methyl ester carboxylesterase
MSTFGLVHGAYHGSWCWSRLQPELERRGHGVVVVDLPCDEPDAGATEYAAVAVEAFRHAPDDLVLVGHSLGGLSLPLIAGLRPVSRMVFLCALLPRVGRAQADVIGAEPDMIGAPSEDGGSHTDARGVTRWEAGVAASWFFSDCPSDVASWAARQLRGQSWKITEEITPLRSWPPVPSTAVIGRSDPVVTTGWSRRVVPTVLGVQPIELDCGHAPFLSAPGRLAEALAVDPVQSR